MTIEKLCGSLEDAIQKICDAIVLLQNNDNDLNLKIERIKNEFQLQISFQSLQITELQKRNDALWEIVTKLKQT